VLISSSREKLRINIWDDELMTGRRFACQFIETPSMDSIGVLFFPIWAIMATTSGSRNVFGGHV
jgi:hypothetical protein